MFLIKVHRFNLIILNIRSTCTFSTKFPKQKLKVPDYQMYLQKIVDVDLSDNKDKH